MKNKKENLVQRKVKKTTGETNKVSKPIKQGQTKIVYNHKIQSRNYYT